MLSCGVLEHVQDPHGSLDEIRRVLRPHGTFYLYNLPNRTAYTERIAKAMGLYYHGSCPTIASTPSAQRVTCSSGTGSRFESCARAHAAARARRAASPSCGMSAPALERVPGLNLVATTIEGVVIAR